MKTISLTLVLIFLTINLYADKNWIRIEPKTKLNVDLPQIQPLNKIIKNIAVFKQLVDATSKKKVATNDKNWFTLNNENAK